MNICRKKECEWRTDLGNGKAYCPFKNCEHSTEIKNDILYIKWLGLLDRKKLYYKRKTD